MSENTDSTADAGEQVQQAEAPATEAAAASDDGFKAPASQEELDRIIQKRLDRERARYADYDDLKARAEKVGELEEKVRGFEAAAARTALVSKVAKETGVDADILSDLRADSEDELTAIASKLRDRFKPTAPHIPGQDKRPDNAPQDPLRETANKLFNRS
jgi:hypothetical protein